MSDQTDFYCDIILSGKEKIEKLYESEKLLAYFHTKPMYEKHIVIVPKEHIPDLLSLKTIHNDLILEVVKVAQDLIQEIGKEKGVRLITNLGQFQDCDHLHFHLIFGKRNK